MTINVLFRLNDGILEAMIEGEGSVEDAYRAKFPTMLVKHGTPPYLYDYVDTQVGSVEDVLAEFPTAIIIGAWQMNGLPVGYHYEEDIDGNQVKTRTLDEVGNPITEYPLDVQKYIDMMPDDNTYDIDGNILTTSRPIAPTIFHSWGGWKDKDLT